MDPHEQYNLKPDISNPEAKQYALDWYSSANVLRTDKTVNIKNRFVVDDAELSVLLGQKFKRTAISTLVTGSVYSVAVNDYLIGLTSLSYAPSIGLPDPKKIGPGKTFIIKDEVGGAATTTITVRSEGEKTIDGAATSTITTNYGTKTYYCDDINWFTR